MDPDLFLRRLLGRLHYEPSIWLTTWSDGEGVPPVRQGTGNPDEPILFGQLGGCLASLEKMFFDVCSSRV